MTATAPETPEPRETAPPKAATKASGRRWTPPAAWLAEPYPADVEKLPPPPETAGPFKLKTALTPGPLGRRFHGEGPDGKAIVNLVEGADAELLGRVKQTLEAFAQVEHPALVKLVGKADDGSWFALPVVECQPLREVVGRGRPLESNELVWVGATMADALAAVHGKQLVHGGVTPDSVGIARDGSVHVLDLGWAPRLRDPAFGTKFVDAAPLDLAQLATVLHFAATGQLPASPWTEGAKPVLLEQVATWIAAGVAKHVDNFRLRPQTVTAREAARRLLAESAACGLTKFEPPEDFVGVARRLLDGTIDETTTQAASATPSLGKFGRYVLMEEIARGGMGVVYKARHAELNRMFALKVLLSGDLQNEVTRQRFLREAEAASQLDHPGVVRVHDFGDHEGRAYLAMDLAEGHPLSSNITTIGNDLRKALGVFEKICEGVHHAHSRGIIHRDLKPQNVIVDKHGTPRVLDFGVAKRLESGDRAGAGLTTEGEVLGTPAYMSPEQAEGRAKDIDTRSDVYSLGVILFEMASGGRLPFEAQNVTDLLTKILLEDPPAPSKYKRDLPWEIDAIVLKALSRDRAARYQSAAELAQDVRRFVDGLPIMAKRAGTLYYAKKWLARNKKIVPFAAVALVALGALPFVFLHAEQQKAAENEGKAKAFVAQGRAALDSNDAGRLKEAHQAFAQALAVKPDDFDARLGVMQVELFQKKAEEEKKRAEEDRKRQESIEAEKQAEKLAAEKKAQAFKDEAKRLVALGKEKLDAGDLEASRTAYLQALAFGDAAEGAQTGLSEATRLLLERDALKEKERRIAESKRLVGEGEAALKGRDPANARTLFGQALQLDGSNADALEGVSRANALAYQLAAEADVKKRKVEAEKLAVAGRESLERGRKLVRDSAAVAAVRMAFYEAIEAYDRAAFLVPEEPGYLEKKKGAARELAVIAKNLQDFGVAEYFFRVSGTAADMEQETGKAVVEKTDEVLEVSEGDAIVIQRSFHEPLEWEVPETREWLAPVREIVAGNRGFKLLVTVHSRVVSSGGGSHKVIFLTGITVRIGDVFANTTSPPAKIEFEEDKYPRTVTATPTGRIVASVKKTLRGDQGDVMWKLKDRTSQLLVDMSKKKKN